MERGDGEVAGGGRYEGEVGGGAVGEDGGVKRVVVVDEEQVVDGQRVGGERDEKVGFGMLESLERGRWLVGHLFVSSCQWGEDKVVCPFFFWRSFESRVFFLFFFFFFFFFFSFFFSFFFFLVFMYLLTNLLALGIGLDQKIQINSSLRFWKILQRCFKGQRGRWLTHVGESQQFAELKSVLSFWVSFPVPVPVPVPFII